MKRFWACFFMLLALGSPKEKYVTEQVYLAYSHHIPEGEAHVSEDLWKKYKGWIFISYGGACHITNVIYGQKEPVIAIRGDGWSLPSRKIVAVLREGR